MRWIAFLLMLITGCASVRKAEVHLHVTYFTPLPVKADVDVKIERYDR
jgi:hypothetical protein